jgi:hypothetical protein
MNIENLSVSELKQLLYAVNRDIKIAKEKAINPPSEYDICNNIAKSFTGKVYDKPVENKRIKQDIQIQRDILDYLNSGNHIICHYARKSKHRPVKALTVLSTKIVSL